MAMELSQESWIIDLLDHFDKDPDPVSQGFETDFLCDIAERFAEEKAEMFVSGKMMNILRRIGEQRYGMKWQEYRDD